MHLQRDESRHDFAFIAGVIVGAITGALATLALTPMSGPETREKLREHAGDLGPVRDRAASVAGAAQQRAASVADSAQHMVATGREKASDLAAKAPVSIPGRQSAELTDDQEQEIDRMTNENPGGSGTSRAASVGASSSDVAGKQPADGSELSPQETGSGSTPHATDPAEGRTDVPPRGSKPESDS